MQVLCTVTETQFFVESCFGLKWGKSIYQPVTENRLIVEKINIVRSQQEKLDTTFGSK